MSVRGSKRKQLIERWLQGEEDENYEVLPTRTEGRFIVKHRKTPLKTSADPLTSAENQEAFDRPENTTANVMNKEEENETATEEPTEPTSTNALLRPKGVVSTPTATSTTMTVGNTSTPTPTPAIEHPLKPGAGEASISLQILEQLRLLGEENRRNNERKERRREAKGMVQRELMKQSRGLRHGRRSLREVSDDSDYYEYSYEDEYSYDRRSEYSPRPVRRSVQRHYEPSCEYSCDRTSTTEGSIEYKPTAPIYTRRRLNLLQRT